MEYRDTNNLTTLPRDTTTTYMRGTENQVTQDAVSNPAEDAKLKILRYHAHYINYFG